MTRHFPDLPDWRFDLHEVSASVYKATGRDRAGRSVSSVGIDRETVLEQCRKDARRITTPDRTGKEDAPMIGILSMDDNAGYGHEPIPVPRDREIAALLESLSVADIEAQVTEEHFPVLAAHAERMASQAVCLRSIRVLKSGLTALGLAGLAAGSRDALTVLPLYYHATRLIGASPDELFRTVAAALGGETESTLLDFLGRSEDDRSLAAMGYRAGRDEDGFRYVRDW